MTDVPFYQTRLGRQFYEATLPRLVAEISRMNDLLARLVEATEARQPADGPTPEERQSQ